MLQTIPKVDRVLDWQDIRLALNVHPRPVVVTAIRSVLEDLRSTAVKGRLTPPVSEESLVARILATIKSSSSPSLHPVVNGTGVVIHTNLGRSLLAIEACQQVLAVSERFSNLEFDLTTGERGERYSHVEALLCELTGCEAALVVNNNAAAVLLSLSALAANSPVIVSRGELVEIGGSFRIPDIMRQSGALLHEVGTTNRTHLQDYQKAISPDTALLLKIHASNFATVGFTAEVTAEDLVTLGKQQGIPVMADIGSGTLLDLTTLTGCHEPTVPEYVRAGVDVITCSGDKLLGGPQAGIILGKREILSHLRRHPLLRALRIDKLTLAALEATLRLYRDERQALAKIPTLRMLTTRPPELRAKGRRYLRRLRPSLASSASLTLVEGTSQVGGGALPLLELPTILISVHGAGWPPQDIDSTFRRLPIPVIGRINKDRYLLDLRTLLDADLPALADALRLIASSPEARSQ